MTDDRDMTSTTYDSCQWMCQGNTVSSTMRVIVDFVTTLGRSHELLERDFRGIGTTLWPMNYKGR